MKDIARSGEMVGVRMFGMIVPAASLSIPKICNTVSVAGKAPSEDRRITVDRSRKVQATSV